MNVKADVYYTWCGFDHDNKIINHILHNYKHQFQIFNYNSIVNPVHTKNYDYTFLNKYPNISFDIFLIPFDECFDLKYYVDEIMKDQNDNYILIINDNVYKYLNDKKIIIFQENKYTFDFNNYEKYIPKYFNSVFLKNNHTNGAHISDSYVNFKSKVPLQCRNRGYVPIGVINNTNEKL